MWKHVIYNPKNNNLASIIKEYANPYGFVLRGSVRVSDNEIVLIFGPVPINMPLNFDKATAGIYC